MKKIAKKNLKLDKEVIASLSENEMVKVTGGDAPPFGPPLEKDTKLGCTTNGLYCGTRGLACGGETGNCVTIPPYSSECQNTLHCVHTDQERCVRLQTDECEDTWNIFEESIAGPPVRYN